MNTAQDIKDFFQDHKDDLCRVRELARKIREMIEVISPFIQQHTSLVCPECPQVCCINRHAYYECDDLIYLYALGLEPHTYKNTGDSEPCQFLSAEGCNLDRTVRPSGCNWYFCGALYDTMEKAPGKAYTDFDDSLEKLAALWMELGSEFRLKFKNIKGSEIGPKL